MPPRAAKKSSAKKRSAMAKNPASASESSPADASTLVVGETTPEPEALSAVPDKDASEADAESGDALAEGKTSPSPAMVEEPAAPIGEDLISPSKSEEPLEDADAELEGEEASDVVAKMEVEEGVKETFDNVVNTRDKVEYEDTDADDAEDVDGDDDNASDADVENVENDDNDHTLDMQAALAEGQNQKGSQIFVGGLDKGAVEDDLIKVFGVFGEVQLARIVRNTTTKKSKGFGFIRFANSEHTMKALAELKDGTEINGKHVRIQASQDNATLYLGNISKTWTRDNVIERLKSFGVEQFDNLILPKDTMNEEKIKGFAFLEFNCHSDAILAFQRLRKPDADFGRDKTVKVAFAHASLHPSEDDLLQVKTVHLDGIPLSWDEEKVKEICEEYGQIERVQLSRNFSSRKRKDFGFVEFSSRESALACVEGINKAQIVDGKAKVIANLAKPVNKGRLAKQGSIQEAGGIVKKRKAPEEILQKEKKRNPKIARLNKPSTSQKRDSKGKSGLQVKMSIRRKKNNGKVTDSDISGRSSKKIRQNHSYGNRKRAYSAIRDASYGARTSAYPARYAYAGASEPQLRPSDLVPHAGYLPALNQGVSTHAYDQRRSGTYSSELRSNFGSGRAISGVPTSYQSDYSIYQGAGYRHHSSGAYAPRGPYYY
ncbi:heterogeneous nuclear ribonucleoprotein Q isoform X2 [Dendrobium catenatum]|uniref:heterogeneous nuclear ribonucleoprotein Q isoform X2 n=1 Tax=Dendrobium catenatum TaxID=906689 RepID=UPI00109F026B|nr:heterogeneous nuclear ribonucleoprotein Q isoform X2 [Dendrobium catenatum]